MRAAIGAAHVGDGMTVWDIIKETEEQRLLDEAALQVRDVGAEESATPPKKKTNGCGICKVIRALSIFLSSPLQLSFALQ